MLSVGGGRNGLLNSLLGWRSRILRRSRRVGLSARCLLQLLRRYVISRQIEAGFHSLVHRLLVHLLDLKVRDRNDALIVRHLIEEGSQAAKRTLHRDVDLLAAVEILLHIILRQELAQRQARGLRAILNTLEDLGKFTLLRQERL